MQNEKLIPYWEDKNCLKLAGDNFIGIECKFFFRYLFKVKIGTDAASGYPRLAVSLFGCDEAE